MIDHDLREGIRATFADVRLGTPLDDVLRRGLARRRRRRLNPAVAGTSAVGLTGTLAAVAGLPGSQVQIAAWTVTARAGHIVDLSVRRPAAVDPNRLASALRDAGVPAVAVAGLTCHQGARPRPDDVVAKKLDVVINTVRGQDHVTTYRINVGAMPKRSKIEIFMGSRRAGAASKHRVGPAAPKPVRDAIIVYRLVALPGDHGTNRQHGLTGQRSRGEPVLVKPTRPVKPTKPR
jgi:hypothetical protein